MPDVKIHLPCVWFLCTRFCAIHYFTGYAVCLAHAFKFLYNYVFMARITAVVLYGRSHDPLSSVSGCRVHFVYLISTRLQHVFKVDNFCCCSGIRSLL